MMFRFFGGILLGYQLGAWISSGSWHNIPVSLASPRCEEVQLWLYRLNPTINWYDCLAKAFAIPLGAVLIAMSFCLARQHPSLR